MSLKINLVTFINQIHVGKKTNLLISEKVGKTPEI